MERWTKPNLLDTSARAGIQLLFAPPGLAKWRGHEILKSIADHYGWLTRKMFKF